ncbi:biogenesis of lysosome-related organelles complex 1 subunit 5 [Coccinella septempunctata]|uniref:biogenesis of lysosome-related organelles complex 1 subunit 5 n=1 Tax=Coccinella septempunctata TaxID=41139 RepID=UPI001D073662|nr:biogenesis of lysosome-related organelles complex 1 subunit 5 [Coccinella septempunctata]
MSTVEVARDQKISIVITRDVGNIWKRLFDHTHFLNGEITYILNEFEVKREDKEVNKLFSIVESITNLRDSGVNKLTKTLDENLYELNQKLTYSLSLSQKVLDLETKYRKDTTLEDCKKERKIIWEQFMDDITEKYSEINNTFEQKETDLRNHYTSLSKQISN